MFRPVDRDRLRAWLVLASQGTLVFEYLTGVLRALYIGEKLGFTFALLLICRVPWRRSLRHYP